jgi:ribose/xylose/arabinose/galactoside ABC-type transport system permease subunit
METPNVTTSDDTIERAGRRAGGLIARLGALRRLFFSKYFVLMLSIVYFLALLPALPPLGTPENLGNIFSNMWPLLAIAIGQTFVLIVGGIDLSQTSTMAVTSVAGAMVMTSSLEPLRFDKSPLWGIMISEQGGLLGASLLAIPVGVLVMLLLGASLGLLNGVAITRLRMPPFMVTLVTMTFFSAFAIWLTKSENVTALPAGYIAIGKGNLIETQVGSAVIGLPYAVLVAGGLALAAHVLLIQTVFGRRLYAIGANTRAAAISGVPTDHAVTLAYVISGVCAAVASILYSTRLEMGFPALGENSLLDVIGAVVIGGTSLFGGKGKVLWTLFGVLFFVLLDNTLNLLSLSAFTIAIVKGGVILLAALLDVTRTRLLAQR